MVKCENLVKKYRRTTAVNDLSLELKPGKIYALLGPNGSGKSTWMKMVAGLTSPTTGRILFDGNPQTWRDKAQVAYMPTEPCYFPYMTCMDLGKYFQDFFEDFDMQQFLHLLDVMELNPKQRIRELSSGMMAKLKISATLSRKARVILLDEPLNGIDIIARDRVVETITGHISDDSAVVISSHLVDELEKIVDYAIYMKNGTCVLQGEADALRQQEDKSLVDIYREIYA